LREQDLKDSLQALSVLGFTHVDMDMFPCLFPYFKGHTQFNQFAKSCQTLGSKTQQKVSIILIKAISPFAQG
jgi:hypothetical protein